MFIDDEPSQEERIIKLRQELEKHGGEVFPVADLSPDLEEEILRKMLAADNADPISLWDLLTRDGVEIPAPDQLNANSLAAKLKEIIDHMASHKVYLSGTNHLSDRQLYEHLYSDTLPDKKGELTIDCIFVIDCSGGRRRRERVDRDQFLPQPPIADEEEHEC